MNRIQFIAAILVGCWVAPAHAEDVTFGNLKISALWVRATPKGAPVGGGYMTITNTGTSTITGNGNSDVSVVGSDNQSYRADLATVTECKDFVDGWFLLAAGASTTGCVVFGLPQGVTPVKVKYVPSSGISHDVGEWLNP